MARGAHVARRLPIVVDQLFPEAGAAGPRTPLCSLSDIQGWILDVSTLTGVVARLGGDWVPELWRISCLSDGCGECGWPSAQLTTDSGAGDRRCHRDSICRPEAGDCSNWLSSTIQKDDPYFFALSVC